MVLLCLPITGLAAQYHGRGVYYFDGPVRSPLAGTGTRGAYATNRVALDDDHTTVSVDTDASRIVFANTHRYSTATIIGDLVLLGSGRNQAGDDVPFAIHLKIEKRGDAFKAQVHPHPTSRDKLSALRFAPLHRRGAWSGRRLSRPVDQARPATGRGAGHWLP